MSAANFFSPHNFIGQIYYSENKIKEHSLGEMNQMCAYCGALYFRSEAPKQASNSFHKCCMDGKYLF